MKSCSSQYQQPCLEELVPLELMQFPKKLPQRPDREWSNGRNGGGWIWTFSREKAVSQAAQSHRLSET